MKNKKGFTLVEMITVLLLIAIIGTIIIVLLFGSKKNKVELEYNNSVDKIVASTTAYMELHSEYQPQVYDNPGSFLVSLQTLIDEGLLSEKDIKNPYTDKSLPLNTAVKISYAGDGNLSYDYLYDGKTTDEDPNSSIAPVTDNYANKNFIKVPTTKVSIYKGTKLDLLHNVMYCYYDSNYNQTCEKNNNIKIKVNNSLINDSVVTFNEVSDSIKVEYILDDNGRTISRIIDIVVNDNACRIVFSGEVNNSEVLYTPESTAVYSVVGSTSNSTYYVSVNKKITAFNSLIKSREINDVSLSLTPNVNTQIFAYCFNSAGELYGSTSEIVHYDNTAPTCSFIGESTTYAKTREISMICTDNVGGSGCEDNQILFFNTTTVKSNLNKIIKDRVGNESLCSKELNVYVDVSSPEYTSSDKPSTENTVSVLVDNLKDDNSGLKSLTCKLGDEEKSLPVMTPQTCTFSVETEKEYSIEVVAKDNLDNSKSEVHSVSTKSLAEYNVTFDGNNGSLNNASSSCKVYPGNTSCKVNLTTGNRNGYILTGFNETKTANNPTITGSTTYINGNTTLYAIWTPINYTVSYNCNSGTGSVSPSNHIYDTAKALTPNSCAKTGFDFLYWNTKADGTGTNYSNAQSVVNLTSTHGATIGLYAIWKNVSNSLIVDPNGGSWNGFTTAKTYTQRIGSTLSIPVPTRSGYVFSSWSRTNSFGTMSSLNAAATYTFGSTAGTTDRITANWVSYVARIGSAYYSSLQAALNAVPANNSLTDVYLLKSVSENVSNTASKYTRLNLSGFTLTGTITNSGNLIVNGSGTVTNTSSSAIVNNASSTLTITNANVSGYINGITTNTIKNSGALVINGTSQITPTSNSAGGSLIYNLGPSVTVSGGTVSNSVGCTICTPTGYAPTITVNGTGRVSNTASWGNAIQMLGGGTFNLSGSGYIDGCLYTMNGVTSTMSGGTIYGGANASPWLVAYHGGRFNINGGTITSTTGNALALYEGANINITGSSTSVTGVTGAYMYNKCGLHNNLTLNSGIITGTKDNGVYLTNSGCEGLDYLYLKGGTLRLIGRTSTDVGVGYAIYNQRQHVYFQGSTVTSTAGSCASLHYSMSYVHYSGGNIQGGWSCSD